MNNLDKLEADQTIKDVYSQVYKGKLPFMVLNLNEDKTKVA